MIYESILNEILDCAEYLLSDIKPSDWAEQNRMMTTDISPIPGMLSYSNSPYTREIVDCLSPEHPARIIAVKKGAQIGFSTTVIEAAIGWIISQSPGNILFLVGHDELVEEAVAKVDRMIDSCGIRNLIKPNAQRVRNMKTGDTNRKKEFPGGSLVAGVANHKLLRNRSIQYGFIDDYEAMKGDTKQAGSTSSMIEGRFAAYAKKMKLFYISTPEIKQTSNIEPVYLLGDQRKYQIPCPCCGDFIDLHWSVPMVNNEKEICGITWKMDGTELISESVGYTCQKCGGFFDDKNKNELVKLGHWLPTAKPSQPGYYSYHISSLYAPAYMYDWEHYVRKYLEANPVGGNQIEELQQTFVNLCLGETYEPTGESIKANTLQKNIRNYPINIIPESLSMADGNGKIVLLTCACDLNGKLDDARLDYEVLAWSQTGATYSITHGSIGTFIPNESGKKNKVVRETWTYENHKQNNVWKEFDKIIGNIYETDTGRKMKVFISGVDTGYCELQAFTYIDNSNYYVLGLKGDKEDKYVKYGIEMPNFKVGQSRAKLFLLRVGQIKDDLQALINLKWDYGNDTVQPSGFMNFPIPSEGKYLLTNYFSHYEAEQRILDKENNFIWQKKTTTSQNHLFDCRIYNLALRDILLFEIAKEYKIKSFDWGQFCKQALGK